ncbi:hypothetical protein T439DRAFT_48652 [Meredithblackwellia eburnea MCA 4105]
MTQIRLFRRPLFLHVAGCRSIACSILQTESPPAKLSRTVHLSMIKNAFLHFNSSQPKIIRNASASCFLSPKMHSRSTAVSPFSCPLDLPLEKVLLLCQKKTSISRLFLHKLRNVHLMNVSLPVVCM